MAVLLPAVLHYETDAPSVCADMNMNTTLPSQVEMSTPTAICPKRLRPFKKLAGWPVSSGSNTVPGMFLMAESFKLVMQVGQRVVPGRCRSARR